MLSAANAQESRPGPLAGAGEASVRPPRSVCQCSYAGYTHLDHQIPVGTHMSCDAGSKLRVWSQGSGTEHGSGARLCDLARALEVCATFSSTIQER